MARSPQERIPAKELREHYVTADGAHAGARRPGSPGGGLMAASPAP